MGKIKKSVLTLILFLGVENIYADEVLTDKQAKIILADENQVLPITKQLFSNGIFQKKTSYLMPNHIEDII